MLGPRWVVVYASPVRNLIKNCGLNYYVYADDIQIYSSFKATQQEAEKCLHRMEECAEEIRDWMRSNFLKLNDNKTEFILFWFSREAEEDQCPSF